MTDEENGCACCGESSGEMELCSACEEGEGSECDCDNEIDEEREGNE